MGARHNKRTHEIFMKYNHVFLSITLQRSNISMIDTRIVKNHYPFKKNNRKKNRNRYEKKQKKRGGFATEPSNFFSTILMNM